MVDFLIKMMEVESTSGSERALADWLRQVLTSEGYTVHQVPADAADGQPVSLYALKGEPKVVYCSHLDTVPPYIPPTLTRDGDITVIKGRGACDAKGQIAAMHEACRRLSLKGATDMALLLLHGEETGSYGAKEFRQQPGGDIVIVGEPTDNKMVSASKGTKAFELTVHGRAFHSGYPQHGVSAIERFVDFVQRLRQHPWPTDPVLGDTTYNIGKLQSDNPQNILSERLTCRIYFRTTFASDSLIEPTLRQIAGDDIDLTAFGGDTPMRYTTFEGMPTTTVSFGSDAPQLSNFKRKALCGPGSILVAHRPEEQITAAELEEAVKLYIEMYKRVTADGE